VDVLVSDQLAIDFTAVAPAVRIGRREFVLRRVAENANRFREGFPLWLEKHMTLWEHYEREANAVWGEGFRHYASRTIWELMRHHTRHREQASEYKLNNNWAPCLARLYLLLYPERDGFFETREAA
jgi:hypothetical protein